MTPREEVVDSIIAAISKRFGLDHDRGYRVVDAGTGEVVAIELGDRVQQQIDDDVLPSEVKVGLVVEIRDDDSVVLARFQRRKGRLAAFGDVLPTTSIDVALVDKAPYLTHDRHRTARQLAEVIASGSGLWRAEDYRHLTWIVALLGSEHTKAGS